MVGIGGSSMSGLAEMLKQHGFEVTGSDRAGGKALVRLRAMGIPCWQGHDPERVLQADLVVYSAAVHPDDPERAAASAANIPQMERAVLLGQLMRGYTQRVGVSGTHGKTTLSAMLAQILVEGGVDPTVHIGGSLASIGGGSRVGSHGVFVVEACEFNRSFLNMPPTIAVITNIEEDHLDCYYDLADIRQAFAQYLDLLPKDGLVIGLADDPEVVKLMAASGRRYQSFSLTEQADWQAGNLRYDEQGHADFDVLHYGEKLGHITLAVPGDFNALHALAAVAAAHALGVDMAIACHALAGFMGAHRRFEFTGEVQGMRMYHDYGHNPAEMQSALRVAKMQRRRVIAVMQPHTYSRVKGLFAGYLTCTQDADITLVTDIYAARETDPGDIHSSMLVDGMRKNGIDAHLTPTFDDTEQWLLKNGRPGDLVLTMGCGDINLLNDRMQRHWDEQQPHGGANA